MFDILKKHPKLLGIGIDEGTAIIVTENTFDIMGDGYVAIYDRTFWSREGVNLKTIPEPESLFYFLRPGDRYDLENRKVISTLLLLSSLLTLSCSSQEKPISRIGWTRRFSQRRSTHQRDG